MKNLLSYSKIVTLFTLVFLLSCSKVEIQSVSGVPNNTVTDDNVDRTDPGGAGRFVYGQLRLHAVHFDPYSQLSHNEASTLKEKFDALKEGSRPDYHTIWKEASQNKLISSKLSSAIIQFHEELDKLSESTSIDPESIDSWFSNKLAYNLERQDLSFADNNFLMRHESLIRYAIKAYVESMPKRVSSVKNAKVAGGSCDSQQFNCYQSTIATYIGIGALFTPDKATGGVVGAVVGAVVSLFTCNCDSNPCTSPRFISTDGNNCYDQNQGLPLVAAGYGSNPNGFRWEVYKSDNMTEANKLVSRFGGDHITIPNSELQGNTQLYIRALTICGPGVEYTPNKLVLVDIVNTLGWPQFYMSGPTNAPVGSTSGYILNGVNLQNVQWSISTYNQANGTFLNRQPDRATIQWNSIPGYIHVSASASTSCGYYSNGLYVTTQQ